MSPDDEGTAAAQFGTHPQNALSGTFEWETGLNYLDSIIDCFQCDLTSGSHEKASANLGMVSLCCKH